MAKEEMNIGLIGLGTIGRGVAQVLVENAKNLKKRAGVAIHLKAACDLNVDVDFGVDLTGVHLTTDANELLDDPEIDIIVEVIGGVGAAKTFIEKALGNSKHVVTSNKEVIAKHGKEFIDLARSKGVNIYYEASCGGGVPIIHGLKNCLSANNVQRLFGIVNGTTNYILSKMTAEGAGFMETLQEAQDLGYAEAEPSSDIDGFDVAYKLSILASIAFDGHFNYEDIEFEGIRDITAVDIASAKEFGYVLKLVAIGIARTETDIELRVHPVMIEKDHPLATVGGPYNAVFVEGNYIGQSMFYGPGAGMLPTASAVVGDIMDLAMERSMTESHPSMFRDFDEMKVVPMSDIESRYFLRMSVKDQAGVLAAVADVCGKHGVSIKSVNQRERPGGEVPLIIMTHLVRESDMQAAIKEIKELDCISSIHRPIRVGL